MNTQELRSKSIEELNTELSELHRERFNLSMQKGMGELSKPHQFGEVRKNIARIKTIIAEKESEL